METGVCSMGLGEENGNWVCSMGLGHDTSENGNWGMQYGIGTGYFREWELGNTVWDWDSIIFGTGECGMERDISTGECSMGMRQDSQTSC